MQRQLPHAVLAILFAAWSGAGLTQTGTTFGTASDQPAGTTTAPGPRAATGSTVQGTAGSSTSVAPAAPNQTPTIQMGPTANPGTAASGAAAPGSPSAPGSSGTVSGSSGTSGTNAASGPATGQGTGVGASTGSSSLIGSAASFDPSSAPGWSLMSPQEQQSYSSRINSFTSLAQCRAYQDAYLAQIQARARNFGQTVQGEGIDPCTALEKQGAIK